MSDSLRCVLFLVLAVLGCCAGCERKPTADAQAAGSAGENVLVVTLDTTRADRLGCYGYTQGTTPTIDALAAKGILFQHAYSQVPITLPSHCTIFTGKYPREHGVRNNGQESLSPDCETLAAVFKRHGYRTGAFVGSFVLDPRFGLDSGFDAYDADMGEVPPDANWLDVERRADVVTDRALKWLGAGEKRPFFCWIHYYDPHEPYEPPPAFRQRFADPYDGEIAFVDSQFRRVMDWLDAARLTSKTLILIVGDHGEGLGEHGEHGHGIFLYDTDLHVPMILLRPGTNTPARRVATDVELVDVFPTVLELMGWPASANLSSRSLAPALQGDLKSQDCYAESLYGLDAYGWAEQRCVITPRWKYISSTRPELFDRQADPPESVNLAPSQTDVANKLRGMLVEHHESLSPGKAREVELSTAARQSLEALGYVGGGRGDQEELFLTAAAPDPKDLLEVTTSLEKARRLLRAEKSAEAIAILKQAVERSPGSRLLHYNLGLGLLEAGQVDAAVKELDAALRIDPRYAEAMLSMGDALLTLRQLDKAVECYRDAVALKDNLVEGHFRLGWALRESGRIDEALAAYRKAVSLTPGYAEAYAEIGAILIGRKQLPEAVRNLREAVRLKPNLGQALNRLGIALAQQGQVAEAKETFRKAAQMPDAAAEAYFNLGVAAANENNIPEAIASHERCIQLNPAYSPSVEFLAGIYLTQHRTADAIRVLRTGTTASPNELRLANSLAWLLATTLDDKLRDGPTALELARRAAELTNFQNPAALRTLAAAYAEIGDFKQAAQSAEQALELAVGSQQKDLADLLRAQIDLYKAGRPSRAPN